MRIGVWGLGRHATNNILPALALMNEFMLYGVCSRNTDTVFRTAEQWNCKAWTDAAQMLSDSHLDIVYLATPIGLHAEQGTQVLEAKKHSGEVSRPS